MSVKNKLWKSVIAFTLAMTLVAGSSPFDAGGGTTGYITVNGGTVSNNYGGGVSTCGYCYGDEYVTVIKVSQSILTVI